MDVGHEVAEGVDGHEQRVPTGYAVERSALDPIPLIPMSRRIDIELTSNRPDGTWTWRAAGAQKPKGVLDGALLPAGAVVGQILRADADAQIEGLTIVSVTAPKEKADKDGVLELIASDKPFEGVTQTLAKRDRNDRGPRRRRPSRSCAPGRSSRRRPRPA